MKNINFQELNDFYDEFCEVSGVKTDRGTIEKSTSIFSLQNASLSQLTILKDLLRKKSIYWNAIRVLLTKDMLKN